MKIATLLAALTAATLFAGNVNANPGDMNVASTTAKNAVISNMTAPPDTEYNANMPAPNIADMIAIQKEDTDVNTADDPGGSNAPPGADNNTGNQIVANSFNPVAAPNDVGKASINSGIIGNKNADDSTNTALGGGAHRLVTA